MTYPSFDPSLPVCCDFDGVLAECTYPSPELGRSIQAGIDLLLHYYNQGCEIVILTSRPESHWPRIWKWLDEVGLHGIVYDITNQKVRAGLYVDDRAVRFPIQMNLPNDEVEVPWGDVPSLPLEVIADTEPDEEDQLWENTLMDGLEDELYPAVAFPSQGQWTKYLDKVRQIAEYSGRRHPSSVRFHKILKELGELHDQKSVGYGTDEDPLANVRASAEWGMPAWVGAMVRLGDKLKRLQAYAQKGELPFEAVEDAFRDAAVYAVIGLVLFEQENAAKV